MEAFFSTYVFPGLLVLAQSLALIVILLIGVAYLLYADRKVWAAVSAPGLRGPVEIRLQGAGDSLRRQ